MLRAAIEYDCDARLLDTGRVALPDYATTLLEIAERRQRTPLMAVTLAPVRSHIGKRVIAMTEFGRRPRFGTAAVAASLSVVLFAAACETPEPLALEPEAAPTIGGQLVEFVSDSIKTIHLPLKFAIDVGNGVHEFEVSRVEIVEFTELTATAVRLHVGLKSKLREREGT